MLSNKLPNYKIELRFIVRNVSKKTLKVEITSPTATSDQHPFFITEEQNSKNTTAKFNKSFIINYGIDKDIEYRFVCANGFYETTIKKILSKPYKIDTGNLLKGDSIVGQIEIIAEEIPFSNNEIYLGINGLNLDSKDLNGKSDPFFKVYKLDQYGKKKFVYESEVQKKTLNPNFNYISMPLVKWCSNDITRELIIKVYDWNLIGKSEKIGICRLTTEQILDQSKSTKEFIIINKKKKAGYLQVHFAKIIKKYSIMDYIAGGCQLSVMVAIDCSSSNSKKKFHNFSENEESDYGSAIFKITDFLEDWPSNGSIEVLGFSGIIPNTDHKSYCFPFSLDPKNAFVNSANDIFKLYYNNIDEITPTDPSKINEVFQYAINKSLPPIDQSEEQLNQKYTILLIFTDGDITDIEESYKILLNASELPLSIILVQIGDCYNLSRKLNNLENYLDHHDLLNKPKPNRGIVNHVEYTKDIKRFYNLEVDIMKNVPTQFTSYFINKNIDPNSPNNIRYYTPIIPQ
ncbi:hypothetical protein ACTFIV_009480 [Dictyostelium citrinum]